MSATAEAYILFLFFMILMFLLYGFFQKRLHVESDILSGQNLSGLSVLVQERLCRRYVDLALPDDNGIYNISSRVQGQQSQYPDAYLSVDHITISNELNKPPKYDDAPPSYEEAVKLAMAHSNSIQTFQAEQVNNTRPQAHSSTTTTVVVPAVAGQSTE
ncbi:uncharacterized protein [Euwallacea similis]|uniref:uncharacterized protein isoform X3 n=1 Tax=Euwallacea similis TaxID=1736056 RepID=UPI00344ECD8A